VPIRSSRSRFAPSPNGPNKRKFIITFCFSSSLFFVDPPNNQKKKYKSVSASLILNSYRQTHPNPRSNPSRQIRLIRQSLLDRWNQAMVEVESYLWVSRRGVRIVSKLGVFSSWWPTNRISYSKDIFVYFCHVWFGRAYGSSPAAVRGWLSSRRRVPFFYPSLFLFLFIMSAFVSPLWSWRFGLCNVNLSPLFENCGCDWL